MMFPETMPFDSFNVEKAVAGTMNFDQHQGMFEMPETLPACDFLPFPGYHVTPHPSLLGNKFLKGTPSLFLILIY